MNKDLRWRIIILQVVMIVVFGFGAGLAYYAGNFTHDQIKAQLEPQQITFPAVGKGSSYNLHSTQDSRVLTGDQAHAYADKIYWPGLQPDGRSRRETRIILVWCSPNPEIPREVQQPQHSVETMFKGETLLLDVEPGMGLRKNGRHRNLRINRPGTRRTDGGRNTSLRAL